jgi:hypothetical protein
MLEHYARTFVVHPEYIRFMEYELRNPTYKDGREVLARGGNGLFLDTFEEFANKLGLQSVVRQSQTIRGRMQWPDLAYPAALAADDLYQLRFRFEEELTDQKILWIGPNDRAAYWQRKSPFGDEVDIKFPRPSPDSPVVADEIVSAGNCLALDQPTAAVFHLMRTMEIGVQTLAGKLGFGYTDVKNLVWARIINLMEGALRRNANPLPLTDDEKKPYFQATSLLFTVKEAWRNEVMHPHVSYTRLEGENVYQSVRAFMQHLAKLV